MMINHLPERSILMDLPNRSHQPVYTGVDSEFLYIRQLRSGGRGGGGGGLRILVPCAKILHIIECAVEPSAVGTWP